MRKFWAPPAFPDAGKTEAARTIFMMMQVVDLFQKAKSYEPA